MADDKKLDPLDLIAIEAQAEESAQEAAQDAVLNPQTEPAIDPAQAWAQIPKMFGGILSMALPELKDAYSDAACLQWGAAMQLVAAKYEWDAAETMSRFGPEIALVVATIPLALPTITAIKQRRKQDVKKPADEAITVQVNEAAAGGADGTQ